MSTVATDTTGETKPVTAEETLDNVERFFNLCLLGAVLIRIGYRVGVDESEKRLAASAPPAS